LTRSGKTPASAPRSWPACTGPPASKRNNAGPHATLIWLEYDPRGDIAYIHVSPVAANAIIDHTERVGDDDEYGRGIDIRADGTIVGYEFMNASHGLNLNELPHRDELAVFMAQVAGLRVLSSAG
jgi:uncharacterized protein YuzE